MQVKKIGTGNHASYSLSGSVLTVGGYALNLEERRCNPAKLVNLYLLNGEVTEKPSGVGLFMASIQIPPKKMIPEEVESEDQEDETKNIYREDALNVDDVLLMLWPINK